MDPIIHTVRYAGFGVVLFFLVACMVANLRRGRAGRRLVAVRDNERAAASVGVGVAAAKMYAFAVASGIAAIGGILLAFQNPNVVFDPYDVFNSINGILFSVIGGIGFLGGALTAGGGAPSGPFQELINHWLQPGNWYIFYAGLITLVALLLNPDGVAAKQAEQIAWLKTKVSLGWAQGRTWDLTTPPVRQVPPKTLTVEGLSVKFGSVFALNDVSLSVPPGRVVGLIGPNGAGKTTLIDAVTGFISPHQGEVSVEGNPITRMSASARARIGLTRSFQSLELFEDLSVADNLRTASDDDRFSPYLTDLVHPGRPELSPYAVTAVKEFDLEPYLNKFPRELPYAQRRLVGIARAVAAGPSVLLLDEPAAGLDPQSTAELGRLIRRLAEDWGMSILLIEHDVQMVLGICDQIVVLNFGNMLATGSPDEVRRDPEVIAAYLGTSASGDAEEPEGEHDGSPARERQSTGGA